MNFPSTTQVLRPYMDLTWIKDGAMQRGSARHASYSAYLLGTWAPPLPAEDQGFLRSFQGWVDAHVLTVLAVELSLVDKDHGFSGTLDAILETDLCPCLLADWKPQSISKTWKPQIASYRHLALKHKFPIKKAAYLQPDKEGETARLTYCDDSTVDFSAFLSALNCYRYFNQ